MTVVAIVMGQTVPLMNLINTALHTLENKLSLSLTLVRQSHQHIFKFII